MLPRMPIGISDFQKLRQGGYYFVDKSRLIAQWFRNDAETVLIPRPRRFGKTLNLSMLRCFFSTEMADEQDLFAGLAIESDREMMALRGTYPVVFLSLRDVRQTSLEESIAGLRSVLASVFGVHVDQIRDVCRIPGETARVDSILGGEADLTTLQIGLTLLTELLYRAHGKRAIVLIDEYDAPIHAGQEHGFYEAITPVIRNLLSGAFKDNSHLEKGLVTGIMRVARESIFSGLNNLDVCDWSSLDFADGFGFTQGEVDRLLIAKDLGEKKEEVREWYNGYRFGETELYNPWSILQYVRKHREGFQPYWVNTSANTLIRNLIVDENAIDRSDLSTLLQMGTISATLRPDVVLRDLNRETIWSLLTYSGYLKPLGKDPDTDRYRLAIPNREIHQFFEYTVRGWLEQHIGDRELSTLFKSLLEENFAEFETRLASLVRTTLSFHDTAGREPERVFHAFLLGLLVEQGSRFEVRSNRESGLGRYDIALVPREEGGTGFLFEVKKASRGMLDSRADDALEQMRERQYATEIGDRGCDRIVGLAVAISGKEIALRHCLL